MLLVLWAVFFLQRNPKVAYYSFPKKRIKILKSVKLKQQDVSSEVLVPAIDSKFSFLFSENWTVVSHLKRKQEQNTLAYGESC